MYPFEVDVVVPVELVANSLDAGASQISIEYNPEQNVLMITDNGEGMSAQQFKEYHDFAAGLKTRGSGIGFAGVGAKISFNIADTVLTETRSKSFSGGSNWFLESKKKLVWEDVEPAHIQGHGTMVQVWFRPDGRPSYQTTDDILTLLKQHYLPLMDPAFLDLYSRIGFYSDDLRFAINGTLVEPFKIAESFGAEKKKETKFMKGGKGIGYGLFCLASVEYPLGHELPGVLLCTHGKVIKGDFFNQFPGVLGPRIFGVVEIPRFVDFLTTAKTDFIRGRGRNREFENLYDPIRSAFKEWLGELGVQPMELSKADDALRLERELKKLVEEIPELSEFFGFSSPKVVLRKSETGPVSAEPHEGAEETYPNGEGENGGQVAPTDVGDGPDVALEQVRGGAVAAQPISRKAKRGPKIAFQSVPDRVDLSWVEGNHIIINSGHPSYRKVGSDSAARRSHCMFAIGTAIQRFMIEQESRDYLFTDRLMAAWGRQ
jgi:hypothetical protein